MENKQAKPIDKKNGYPTFFGELCFLIFNLISLSLVSWVLLEAWFSIQIVMDNTPNLEIFSQHVLERDLNAITSNYQISFSKILKSITDAQNILHLECGRYINRNIIDIFFNILEITLTRFYLFILFIPFMMLILSICVIDGLVQRDKRKFQGARESTLLFHRLKPLAKFFFYLLFFIYMTIPLETSPEIFLVPMTILSSLFTMFSIKSFKKYL